MKKTLTLFLIFFITSFSAIAQDQVHSFVKQKASPKEGLQTFMKQFAQEFNTNNAKAIPKSVNQIKFKVKFIIEKDGSFSEINVVDDEYKFEREVKRVFNLMPVWNAAIHDGNPVRSSFTMPVTLKYDQSDLSSEKDIFLNESQINSYLETLNENTIENTYFNLTCNCSIVRSSTSEDLMTEEFFIASQDDKVTYNVIFKQITQENGYAELQKIKLEAQERKAEFRELKFLGYNSLAIGFYAKDADYVSQYQTLFIPTKDYLVIVNLQSNNKQLTRLSFNHLLKNFKLKI